MSQASVDEIKPAGVPSSFSDEKVNNDTNHNQQQPNVRHIPIFVEGRDEPIINKNINISPENVHVPAPTINDSPHPQSIFNRAKNIPVRKPSASFEIPVTNIGVGVRPEPHSQGHTVPIKPTANFDVPITNIDDMRRSESPARTIPIKVEHVQTKPSPKAGSPAPTARNSSQLNDNNSRSRSSSPMPPQPKPMDSITRIQQIQKETIELMKRVEIFKGTRKDKEYMYLDEMLTQNLLKLDTIDTEGKENIKAARKEVINCINKCIAVLEAKVEEGEKESNDDNNLTYNSESSNPSMSTERSQSAEGNPEVNAKLNESEQKSQMNSENNKISEKSP